MSEESRKKFDVHDYVKERLTESGFDPTDDPLEVQNLIVNAATTYILSAPTDEIEDYEYHYLTTIRISQMVDESNRQFKETTSEVYSTLLEADGVSEEEAMEQAERHGRFVVGNHFTLVYSMAYEFVHDMLEHLLPRVLADDLGDDAADVLVSQLGAYDAKVQLLGKTELLDEETRNGVNHIQKIRGDLVHNVKDRFLLHRLDDLEEVNTVRTTVSHLFEQVYGFPAYRVEDE